jgi:hypothetical protein
MKNKPVLVTTEFRGVFFGYVKDDKKSPDQITLTNVRNCIYWSADVGGFLGLASGGPTSGCKLGAKLLELTIYKITSIAPVSEEAEKKWNS